MRYIGSNISFIGKLYRYRYSKSSTSATDIANPIIGTSLNKMERFSYEGGVVDVDVRISSHLKKGWLGLV